MTRGMALLLGFPGGSEVKNPPAMQETRVRSLGKGDPPGEGNDTILQYSCLENSRQRSLAGYSLWDHKESDTTERLTHFTPLCCYDLNKSPCVPCMSGSRLPTVGNILCVTHPSGTPFSSLAQSSLPYWYFLALLPK